MKTIFLIDKNYSDASKGGDGQLSPRGAGGGTGGGTCRVCHALLEEDKLTDTRAVEKSTRVILGLMSHYSETLLSVIKRGPQTRDVELKRHADDSDHEGEEEDTIFTCYCISMSILVVVLIIGASVGIYFVATKGKSSSSSSFLEQSGTTAELYNPLNVLGAFLGLQ
ncbi:unnamed protein product [Amoebophrya sp. A120]|nr:unnamed protein product [Amoebophrya sp. A120]|eukprot:GSA120T00012706001.1